MSQVNSQQSSSFEYQLIPHSQDIRIPAPDMIACLNSKIQKAYKSNSQKTDDRTESQRDHLQKILIQKQKIIKKLRIQYENLKKMHQIDKQTNSIYTKFYEEIGTVLKKGQIRADCLIQEISNIINQNEQLKKQINNLQQTNKQLSESIKYLKSHNPSKTHSQINKIMSEKDRTIENLRQKLLKSTQNNINSIFSTKFSAQQTIHSNIVMIKEKLDKIEKGGFHSSLQQHQCYHKQQLNILMKNYEQMLQEYRNNQKIIHTLEHRQDQFHHYLSSLKTQLVQSLTTPPHSIYLQNQENKIKVFLSEIEKLNEKLIIKQAEFHNMKFQKERLENQIENMKRVYSIGKSKMLEEEIRSKDRRIVQLENTIIDHIGSRVTENSINSQQSDRQKQINNIRNLKVLVKDLKQKNKILEHKLSSHLHHTPEPLLTKKVPYLQQQTSKNPTKPPQNKSLILHNNLTSESQQIMSGFERIPDRDEQVCEIVEDMIYKMIETKRKGQSHCNCIEAVTDILLEYQEEFQDLERILLETGLVAVSSNLLLTPFGEVPADDV